MATLAYGLRDHDFCQAFDEWALPLQYFDFELPLNSGLIAGFTPTVI